MAVASGPRGAVHRRPVTGDRLDRHAQPARLAPAPVGQAPDQTGRANRPARVGHQRIGRAREAQQGRRGQGCGRELAARLGGGARDEHHAARGDEPLAHTVVPPLLPAIGEHRGEAGPRTALRQPGERRHVPPIHAQPVQDHQQRSGPKRGPRQPVRSPRPFYIDPILPQSPGLLRSPPPRDGPPSPSPCPGAACVHGLNVEQRSVASPSTATRSTPRD
jgi:hypothetical protein